MRTSLRYALTLLACGGCSARSASPGAITVNVGDNARDASAMVDAWEAAVESGITTRAAETGAHNPSGPPEGAIYTMAWKDRETFAVAHGTRVSIFTVGPTMTSTHTLETGAVARLVFSHRGDLLVASGTGKTTVWNTSNYTLQRKLETEMTPTHVTRDGAFLTSGGSTFSPSGAPGCDYVTANADDQRFPPTWHGEAVLHRDGTSFVMPGPLGVQRMSFKTCKILARASTYRSNGGVTWFNVSPKGTYFVVGEDDSYSVGVFLTQTGQQLRRRLVTFGVFVSHRTAFSHDEKILTVSGADYHPNDPSKMRRTLYIYALPSFRVLHQRVLADTGPTFAVMGDGLHAVSADPLRVFDLRRMDERIALEEAPEVVDYGDIMGAPSSSPWNFESPDGKWIVHHGGIGSPRMRVWSTETGKLAMAFAPPP